MKSAKQLATDLYEAALHRDIEKFDALLEEGADCNATIRTLFNGAHTEGTVFERLIVAGHDYLAAKALKKQHPHKGSLSALLKLAANESRPLAVNELLHLGADPNGGGNPVMGALAGTTHGWIASRLLEAGADPNGTDRADATPLHYAMGAGVPELVHMLLEAGADPNGVDATGATPLLSEIAKHGYDAQLEELDDLLQHGARFDMCDNNGDSVFHKLARDPYHSNTEPLARFLIKGGAKLDVANAEGNTALHIAAQDNDAPEMAALFLRCGALFTIPNRQGKTARDLLVERQQKHPFSDRLLDIIRTMNEKLATLVTEREATLSPEEAPRRTRPHRQPV